MSVDSSIQVGCVGSVAWVRIDGAANHENAGCIRQFMQECLRKGWTNFVIDLNHCRGIDSTFIGMLYRHAVRLEGEKGSLEIINAGDRNERSIRKLGLDRLIQMDPEGLKWKREQELVRENLAKQDCCVPLSKLEHTQMVLDAHEALVLANQENESRFCDVIEFLKQDLEAQTVDN
ncbi:MAG: STAS domain-containing protein [Verrucomicrobiales bacterium]|nr:STAS domain-containing protein [Verrucomicrobiales bacterium]